jgi:hypothetical protein
MERVYDPHESQEHFVRAHGHGKKVFVNCMLLFAAKDVLNVVRSFPWLFFITME